MRQQYLEESGVWNGEHYGPGLVEVPDDFPQPKGDEAAMTEEAVDLQYFRANREAIKQYREMKSAGLQGNDAGIMLPESGDPRAVGTPTGSNQGEQTGVVDEGSVPENAAGKREGDALNVSAPAATAAPVAPPRTASRSTSARNTAQAEAPPPAGEPTIKPE